MKLTKKFLLGLTPEICGDWSSKGDVERDFNFTLDEKEKIIFAWYEYADYSGSAYVLGYDKGSNMFFEVHGSHCSCYGLEDQWSPEYCTVTELQELFERRFEPADWRSSDNPIEFQNWLGWK